MLSLLPYLNFALKLQVVTRLMRYFPDLTWETANDIVETAFVNEIALVRIVNSVVRSHFVMMRQKYLSALSSLTFSRSFFTLNNSAKRSLL